MRLRLVFAGLLAFLSATAAAAQTFNQAIIFGDSTVDSGNYRFNPPGTGFAGFNAAIVTAIGQGGNVSFTTTPGQMPSQVLASYFGLSADPSFGGGTNYAMGGARGYLSNVGIPGNPLFPTAVPTTTQIANYLAANNGVADRNGLYLISTGGNDQSYAFNFFAPGSPQAGGATNRVQYFNNVANALTVSITDLHNAGARYIIVPNVNYSQSLGFGALGSSQSFAFSQALWNGLAANGVNFIPADRDVVLVSILANPSAFGFSNVQQGIGGVPGSVNTGACANPLGFNGAWSLLCSPQNLVAPNAQNTFLWADNEHFTAAGQKIFGDYYYSLVVAPSQISFLAENAVKQRTKSTLAIQNQIGASEQQSGPSGFNAWVTGDVSRLSIQNYPGFPDDPATPLTLFAGLDYKLNGNVIVGGVISAATQKSSFSTVGNFTQDEWAAALYAAYTGGPVWGNVIASYGHLDYSVNRTVPIGITLQRNHGDTTGSNWSLAAEAGFKFASGGWLTHGPVAGIALQRVEVGDFMETGSFTSLAFGGQTRNSAVTALGYRAAIEAGLLLPFVQVVWKHELADTDREVTAWLTTITAPGYHMPAVEVGRDWGTATLGATMKLRPGVTALGAVTAEFGQRDRDVVTYGAQIGINVAF